MMALGMSGVANAADEPATGRVADGPVLGVVFNSIEGTRKIISVERIQLTPTGSDKAVLAYCIDLGHPIDESLTYTETTWTESEVKNLAKVQWILTNSFPTTGVEALFEAAKVDVPKDAKAEDLAKLAYVATQAAIWSFSDADLFKFLALPASDSDAAKRDDVKWAANALQMSPEEFVLRYRMITALHDYLVKNAKAESEPTTVLSITPATATGPVGTKVGPFTVTSAVGDVELTATGTAGALVDDKGNAVTKVKTGAKVFVDCKSVGDVKIDAKVKFDVPIGRVFTVKKAKDAAEVQTATARRFQKVILAGSVGKEKTASATATCTAKPALPVTGAPVVGTLAAGFVLLGAGAGLFLLRRRRIQFTA